MKRGMSDEGFERIATVLKSAQAENEILDSMARTLWASSWADAWERLFEEYDTDFLREAAAEHGVEIPSFSQMDILEIAPPTPASAYDAARKIYAEIESLNGVSLETFMPDADSSEFGMYLAAESQGMGISWSDSHEDHGLKIPYHESHIDVPEVYEFEEFLKENYDF